MKHAWLVPFTLFACADSEPPSWGSNAELEASDIDTSSVTLRWGEASDNEALRGYELLRDGEVIETFGTDVHEHSLDGLADATTYSFSIVAEDTTDNPSEPLHVEVTTLDGTPPSFPANANIVAVPTEDGTRVTLTWPQASDNVGVERYEIHRNGEPEAQIATNTIQLEGGPEGITIYAVDARGNSSTPIASRGDAAERVADAEPTEQPAGDPDMAPVQIQLSPAIQRAVSQTRSAKIQGGLRITPMLPTPR